MSSKKKMSIFDFFCGLKTSSASKNMIAMFEEDVMNKKTAQRCTKTLQKLGILISKVLNQNNKKSYLTELPIEKVSYFCYLTFHFKKLKISQN